MQKKAIVNFMREYSMIIIPISWIFIFILLLLFLFIEDVSKWNWNAVGVVGALFSAFIASGIAIKQASTANKNTKNNIQIRRAQFTNEFIKEFKKIMPDLYFCAHLCSDYIKADDNLKKLNEKLLEKDKFDFSIIEYKKLKNELKINDETIRNAKKNYVNNTKNIENIIDITQKYYDTYKFDGESIFNIAHKQYMNDLKELQKDIVNGKYFFNSSHKKYVNDLKELQKDTVKAEDKETLEDIKKSKDAEELDPITKLSEDYVASIFINMQHVVNDLECSTLSAQFDLLDYDKITNLVYAPLYYYTSNLYIRMMENMIECAEENTVIYSNIKEFCSEIITIKKNFDKKIDEERRRSEKRKEEMMKVEPGKLEQNEN